MTRAVVVCSLIIAVAAPAYAGVLLPNGSFESYTGDAGWAASITSWTPSSASGERLGLFFVFDGLSATDGRAFAGLTNNGGGAMSITSSSFMIKRDLIRFNYAYATATPGDTDNEDPFTVTLFTTGSSTKRVSDSMDSNLSKGQMGPSPFATGTQDTGWRTFEIDTSALKGQTATLLFTIGDSGEGGGVAGVFLDNVHQIPEPGTFALFGIGILGFALYGRRRFRKS